MIELITSIDTSKAFSIIQSATIKMKQNNIHQWDDIYPNKFIIAEDITKGHAYGYYDSNTLCGFFCYK